MSCQRIPSSLPMPASSKKYTQSIMERKRHSLIERQCWWVCLRASDGLTQFLLSYQLFMPAFSARKGKNGKRLCIIILAVARHIVSAYAKTTQEEENGLLSWKEEKVWREGGHNWPPFLLCSIIASQIHNWNHHSDVSSRWRPPFFLGRSIIRRCSMDWDRAGGMTAGKERRGTCQRNMKRTSEPCD